ncbi:MAG TPA: ribonucleotide-diphosphate reductase subunit beta [Solirubrobacteraceae bacterium]|nr:ribonucleotide-diphosphate reductase subunit beta [Solirubrobacteraceae bacterium]
MSTTSEHHQQSGERFRRAGEPANLPADQISYTDLYARWERGNWSATELDFSEDARQWHSELDELQRTAALWNYALFFWGEDAVADNLSPYIDAAPREEQKYFLATQQVDEARHAVFFKRFMTEVCGVGGDDAGSSLEAIRPQLTPGFKVIFGRLDRMARELRADPSRSRLAAAVALYHIVIEAGLAQPGQHMITDYLTQRDILPAFRTGMENIANDEQRHIAFGVKILSDLKREDARVPHAVVALLNEVLPFTGQVLQPPGWDERYVSCFGYSFDRIGALGVSSLQSRLRAAGLAPEELPGQPVFFPGMSPEEVARRGRALAMAGVTGVREGPTKRDPETVALLFDTMRRRVNPGHGLKRPTTFEWDFTDDDIPSWHLTIDGGDVRVAEGSAARADLRLQVAYQDWVDIIGGRRDPRRALLGGRLRPRGNPLALRKLAQVFT